MGREKGTSMSKATEKIIGGPMRRLVGLVQSAIRSTAGSMFLDIPVDEDLTESIEAMLKEENLYGKSDGDAVRSVIRRIFGNHEERMIDAARDDANGGMTRALRSLPNAGAMARGLAAQESESPNNFDG
jgi:hypothetical protein